MAQAGSRRRGRRRARRVTLAAAIAAAARLHAGKTDRAGAPYILHPLRVMLRMGTERGRILAVLHDVPEDAGWAALRGELGRVPAWLERGLSALTRRPGESYQAYVERLGRARLPRAVKLCDLADNLDPSRIPAPTAGDRARAARYRRARALLRALAREGGRGRPG